ncbi:MAG: protein-disulfide reductase DsbD family protein [Thermoanaerobaculia bacterium]
MKTIVFVLTGLMVAVSPLFAQEPIALGTHGSGIDPAPLVTLSVEYTRVEGEQVEGVVRARIEQGWHVNSWKPLDEFAIPTKLELRSTALEVTSIEYPPHKEQEFEFAGGNKLAVYDGTIAMPFKAHMTALVGSVEAVLHYQACNDRLCLPPRETTLIVGFNGVAGKGVESEAAPDVAGAESFTPLSSAPPPAGRTSLFSGDIGATMASRGMLVTLLVIFVLGLALNLTPCVYPLIPITLAYFASQTEGKKSRVAGFAALYTLGLAVTYSALGVFSALSGKLFGGWLQHPGVLIFFALLMLVLASSMFGAFDIRVPQFIMNRAGARSGYVGALTMGLLAGIVAAPCVGPFIISLIAVVSQKGDPVLGFTLFFVLALGLGFPYFLLGLFSTSVPRSGPWMVQIKKAMGFILIALAFYFLRPLIGEDAYRWGIALSLLVGALFLFVKRDANRAGNTLRIASAILLLVGGVAFAVPRPHGEGIQWETYDSASLARASAMGKPVVIDFYADWCMPCKELDEKTFADPRTIAESDRFVRLKADLTRTGDPETQRLSKQFSIVGVPTIVFLDPKGNEVKSARLSGFESAEKFVKRLEAVR